MTHDIAKLGEYHQVIFTEVAELTNFAGRMMSKASPPFGRNSRRWLESACLSIRRICEYIAVAVVFAHHWDGHDGPDLTKWSPKDLLLTVDALSEHPMPAPCSRPQAGQPLDLNARPICRHALARVYGQCSSLLHVGRPDRILNQTIPPFDLKRMSLAIAELDEVAQSHVLLLPGIKRILIWDGKSKNAFVCESDDVTEGRLTNPPARELNLQLYG